MRLAFIGEPSLGRLSRRQRKELGLTFWSVVATGREIKRRDKKLWKLASKQERVELVKGRLHTLRTSAYDQHVADIDWELVLTWLKWILTFAILFI